jgi:hypothetical protein
MEAVLEFSTMHAPITGMNAGILKTATNAMVLYASTPGLRFASVMKKRSNTSQPMKIPMIALTNTWMV